MNKEEIINKLFANQIKNVDQKYRLSTKDIIRLSSYIHTDPFSEDECCKWKGAISKSSHQSKYINFWFNKKKQALHRILYLNYKGELLKNKYLRFNCPDQQMRGICCNINHLDLINKDDQLNDIINEQLNQQIETTSKKKTNKKNDKNESNVETIFQAQNLYDKNRFIIIFDE